jgi:hypothetical protein
VLLDHGPRLDALVASQAAAAEQDAPLQTLRGTRGGDEMNDDDSVRWMQECGQEQEQMMLAALARCRQAGAAQDDVEALAAMLGVGDTYKRQANARSTHA